MSEAEVEKSAERDAAAYAADEVEVALRHLRLAAEHCRNREVPRDAAHGFAAYGHLLKASEALGESAKHHAAKARA